MIFQRDFLHVLLVVKKSAVSLYILFDIFTNPFNLNSIENLSVCSMQIRDPFDGRTGSVDFFSQARKTTAYSSIE